MRGQAFAVLGFEIRSTEPQPAGVPNHVSAKDQLNETAPDIFPSVAQEEQSKPELGYRRLDTSVSQYKEAGTPVGNRTRVRGGRIQSETP